MSLMGEDVLSDQGSSGPIIVKSCIKHLMRSDRTQVLVLCIFHLLQQVRRWLHDAENGIQMDNTL